MLRLSHKLTKVQNIFLSDRSLLGKLKTRMSPKASIRLLKYIYYYERKQATYDKQQR